MMTIRATFSTKMSRFWWNRDRRTQYRLKQKWR